MFQLALGKKVSRDLVVMGLVALAAAVVFEVARVALDQAHVPLLTWPWTIETVLEEGAETAGWILITTAVAVRLITARRGREPVR